jgi:hypothetical protein
MMALAAHRFGKIQIKFGFSLDLDNFLWPKGAKRTKETISHAQECKFISILFAKSKFCTIFATGKARL